MARKKSGTFKVGRDAKTGKFIPVKKGERRKKSIGVNVYSWGYPFRF